MGSCIHVSVDGALMCLQDRLRVIVAVQLRAQMWESENKDVRMNERVGWCVEEERNNVYSRIEVTQE